MDMHDYPVAAKAMGTRWVELYGIPEKPGQPESAATASLNRVFDDLKDRWGPNQAPDNNRMHL